MPHTTAPWEMFEFLPPTNDWTGASFFIRSPDAPGGVAVTIGGVGAEEEANARLIAAAPDLLAACKLALGAFERHDAIDWNVLSLAIAKVEGE